MSSENTCAGCETVVIVGPTGSGKTAVAVEIAREIGGADGVGVEIVSADSRAIYKGMDVGTAKPSLEEQRGVPHWGLDLVEPGERFTAADFKEYALEKIGEIRGRGRVPMVVGGTGLYVDALVYDYKFVGPTGERIGDFEQKSCSDRTGVKAGFLMFGVWWEMSELKERLRRRVEMMFDDPELFAETERLVERYGWGSQAMKSNVYRYAWAYMRGEMSREEAVELNTLEDYHLAKRQMTWFKRNPEIVWLPLAEMKSNVLKCMQNEQRK